MSIIASVKVYDGIVLGADSATSISGKDLKGNINILKTYRFANKLFQFQKSPIGILTYGIGNIGKKSIETLLRDFDKELETEKSSKYKVENVAKLLFKFFRDKHNELFKEVPEEKKQVLGFFIGGYSSKSSEGEEWEFILPKDKSCRKVREKDAFGASWRGITLPFTRLYQGYDPRIKQDLISSGVDKNLVEEIFNRYKSPIIYDGMPVKEAIEFIKYILRTTITLASFEIGAPSCSEPVNIAVISPKEGFSLLKEI